MSINLGVFMRLKLHWYHFCVVTCMCRLHSSVYMYSVVVVVDVPRCFLINKHDDDDDDDNHMAAPHLICVDGQLHI